MIKMYRVIPQRASISIENEVEDRITLRRNQFNPQIRSRRTTIEFEAIVDECAFKNNPMHEECIEVQIEETIHRVVLDQYDICYRMNQGYTTVTASGVVVDSKEDDDHPLKHAINRVVNSQKEKP